MSDERHACAYVVPREMLGELFAEHTLYHTIEGWPAGARIVEMHVEPLRSTFVLIVEHPSFPIALPGAELERKYITARVMAAALELRGFDREQLMRRNP